MATGSVSSLGLGSGVLTSDVIDQLKTNDETLTITPITNSITLEQQKSSALNLLNSLMTTLKSSVSALDDDALYQARTVSGNNDAVSVTADSGVSVQSFSITDVVLAQKEIMESGSFSSTDDTVASGSGSLQIDVGGETFTINYTSSMSLSDLKDAINEAAGDKIKASTLQVGTDDYRLVLTSVDTGADQAITLTDTGGNLNSQLAAYDASTNPDGMSEIQAARDATFKYNGISISRSSNTIEDDLIVGVTINLLQESTSGASISIEQDVSAVTDEMSNFVTSYNSLISQLNDMTTSDADAGTVGIFNGDSTINSITRQLNKMLTSVNSDGLSLVQFGIDISEDGTMSFNSSTFETMYNNDSQAAEKLLSGMTTVNSSGVTKTTDGIFTQLASLMDSYLNTGGIIPSLITGSTDALTKLNDNKTRTQALLDARYEAMTARFVQYDAIMTKLTNQFSSLLTQINAYSNGN